MIRIKILKASGILYLAAILVLVSTILFLGYRLIIKEPVSFVLFKSTPLVAYEDVDTSSVFKNMLASGMPAVAAMQNDRSSGLISGIGQLLRTKDLRDPRMLMNYQLPYLPKLVPQIPPAAIPVAGNVTLSGRSDIDRTELDPLEVMIDDAEHSANNLSDEIKILIDQIVDDLEPIALSGEGPQILVYHSHSREAYMQDKKDPYKAAEAFRSNDLNHTVVKVGEVLTGHLKSKGIPTLHDPTEHEQGNYTASYERSLETIVKQMRAHESLQIFLDIHRNAYEKKDPDEEVVIINGERVAKVFVVIGTGEGLLGGFREKPNWQENTKFAIKLTNKINELYPGLAKPVYHKNGRYNQHVSTKAILIEIGSNFTTLTEANRATKYLAEAIGHIVE